MVRHVTVNLGGGAPNTTPGNNLSSTAPDQPPTNPVKIERRIIHNRIQSAIHKGIVEATSRQSVSNSRRRTAPMIEICPATTFDDKSSKTSTKNAGNAEKKVYHFNDIVYQ
jgi:hypothetical protein